MRDKYLTEAMGELPEDKKCLPCDGGCQGSGGCHSAMSFRGVLYIDFSIWQGFGKLWEWAHDQEWWNDEAFFCSSGEGHVTDSGCCVIAMGRLPQFIGPDHFANAVYEFLKGRES